MHDIVIELDSGEPVAARTGRGRGLRRWVVLAGAALVLLGMSGPTRPPAVSLVSVLPDPSGGRGISALSDDVFVVGEPGGVAAYELTGRMRWSARTQDPARQQDLIGFLGDLVVTSSQVGESGNLVTAFHAATGNQRWRLDGRLLRISETRDDLIAVVHNDRTLRVYEVEPLRLRWEIGEVTAAAVDYQARSVVALFTDATIAKLDLDTGAKRGSSRIARAVGGHVSIFLESGLVTVYASWTPTGPLETQVLAVDTLRPVEAKATGPDSAAPTPGWTPLPQQDGSPAAPVILLTQPTLDNRTVIARVRGPDLQVLGTLPFEIDHCIYHAPILACSVPQKRLAVWRIAP